MHVAKKRFRFTCLYCRWRRQWIGKYTPPPYWIKYTYVSLYKTVKVKTYRFENVEFYRSDGGYLTFLRYKTLSIDPRGSFTAWRCAAIKVLDKVMFKTGQYKPFVEFCELLANYP